MSEVTKENMLFHLKHGCSFYPVCPICNAIRVLIEEHGKFKEENIMLLERIENLKHGLIEHGPEVSRKKISQLLAQRPGWDTEVCIIQYLRERGVTVKEG